MEVQNELGVIVVFAQRCKDYGIEIIDIRAEFPDAVVLINGVEYNAEFEYCSSNFKSHNHDIRKCDIVICWKNDWYDCVLPVIEVGKDSYSLPKVLPAKSEKEAAYWQLRALRAERKLNSIGDYGAMAKIRASKNELVTTRRAALVDVLNTQGDIGPTALAEELTAVGYGCTRGTVYNDLKALNADGVLCKNGNGWEVLNNG